jgi:hypothetical protein
MRVEPYHATSCYAVWGISSLMYGVLRDALGWGPLGGFRLLVWQPRVSHLSREAWVPAWHNPQNKAPNPLEAGTRFAQAKRPNETKIPPEKIHNAHFPRHDVCMDKTSPRKIVASSRCSARASALTAPDLSFDTCSSFQIVYRQRQKPWPPKKTKLQISEQPCGLPNPPSQPRKLP